MPDNVTYLRWCHKKLPNGKLCGREVSYLDGRPMVFCEQHFKQVWPETEPPGWGEWEAPLWVRIVTLLAILIGSFFIL